MIWFIFIALICLLLVWFLFGPVIFQINTDRNKYMITLPGIVTANVIQRNERIYIGGWIFFIPLRIDPLKMGRRKRNPGRKTLKKKRSRRNRPGIMKMITKGKRAIWVHDLELDIDTDDFPLNAQLVPVFSALNAGGNMNLKVNFEGRLFLKLDVRTRIATILWMLITK